MTKDVFDDWLAERKIEDVEAFVPDMAGSARGKVVPADKFGSGRMKMPEAIFAQTISGDYVTNDQNVEDRDMLLTPDPSTLRPVPWIAEPAASVFLDCYRSDGSVVDTSPRGVLRSVLGKFEARGWVPIVAPEVEFYLLNPHADPNVALRLLEELRARQGLGQRRFDALLRRNAMLRACACLNAAKMRANAVSRYRM